jgi:uncharacterized protein YbbC (DUF1343 family)
MKRVLIISIAVILSLLNIPLHGQVVSGLDVLKRSEFAQLIGNKIGLITNQTGRSRDGRRSIDLLYEAPNVKLVAIFSPEGGIDGSDERAIIQNKVDQRTQVPIYSLYGETRRPTRKMLQGLDALVYDIQDVGARYYTYITTMAYCMEEAARNGIKFVVLDRPAMINGTVVEGDVLPDSVHKFIAYYPIPTRYGMTPGELAQMWNKEKKIGCKLEVIKLEGWHRSMWYDGTGLRWVNPSPHIRRLDEALLYSGLGAFEATNLSVGRGTDYPFEYYGAPYVDGRELAARLDAKGIAGVQFSPVRFVPTSSTFKNEVCNGVKVEISDRNALRVAEVFVRMALQLKESSPAWEYHSDRFADMVGSSFIIDALDKNLSAEEILKVFDEEVARFETIRAKYLLY